jgi:2-oxoglutarate ferredoxin oxidoreductase subunit alpha
MLEGAQIIVVAYGTAGRIAQTAITKAREAGIPAGLLRPITLYPYPKEALSSLIEQAKAFLVLEMSAGQMLEDVDMVVKGRVPLEFEGWMGGRVPTPAEVLDKIKNVAEKYP